VEGLTPEKLAVSEPFISAFAHATQVALRTQQQEKLEALRNAVLNVATRATEIDEDRQTAFLSLIDRFTPAHIRILEKFRNFPTEGRHDQWSVNKQNPGTPTHWLKEFVPGLREESTNFIRMLIADLYQAGLSSIEPNAQAMPLQAITDVGLGFLNFISAHK
jgi:hypothetical protein